MKLEAGKNIALGAGAVTGGQLDITQQDRSEVVKKHAKIFIEAAIIMNLELYRAIEINDNAKVTKSESLAAFARPPLVVSGQMLVIIGNRNMC